MKPEVLDVISHMNRLNPKDIWDILKHFYGDLLITTLKDEPKVFEKALIINFYRNLLDSTLGKIGALAEFNKRLANEINNLILKDYEKYENPIVHSILHIEMIGKSEITYSIIDETIKKFCANYGIDVGDVDEYGIIQEIIDSYLNIGWIVHFSDVGFSFIKPKKAELNN